MSLHRREADGSAVGVRHRNRSARYGAFYPGPRVACSRRGCWWRDERPVHRSPDGRARCSAVSVDETEESEEPVAALLARLHSQRYDIAGSQEPFRVLTSRLLRAPELLPQLAVLPEVVEAVINGGHGSDLYELNAYVDSIRRSAAAPRPKACATFAARLDVPTGEDALPSQILHGPRQSSTSVQARLPACRRWPATSRCGRARLHDAVMTVRSSRPPSRGESFRATRTLKNASLVSARV